MASVDLRGLTKRFGSLAVVDDVSLRIDHGQLVCLLGPSGCGKTTTLRLIAGFLEPSDGEIHVGERLVSSKARTLPPEQRSMSMIFQSYALWPHMTVDRKHRLRPAPAQDGSRHHREKTRGNPGDDKARSAGAALSRRIVRRTAAARGAGARADRRAGDAAARRAALQPRRQFARGDAVRNPPAARRISLHHGLRHPRPVRGHDHGRPDRGDECRPDRPARHARGHLCAAGIRIRRALHRRQQCHQGHRARRQPCCRSRARRCRWSARRSQPGQSAAVAIRQHDIQLVDAAAGFASNAIKAT